MELYLRETALIVVAYLIGCLTTGYYLVRLRHSTDVRSMGSGSVGATNVGRVLGKRALVITLIGDAAKGAIPVAAALFLDFQQWALIAVLFAVVAGHLWPVQLRFRGGKGLATAMGAVLVMDFRLALAAFAIAGSAWLLFRNTTGSGLGAVAITPLVALIAGQPPLTAAALAVLAATILFAHRANLRAMFADIGKPAVNNPDRTNGGGADNEA